MNNENVKIAEENEEILKNKFYVVGKTKFLLEKSLNKMIEGTKIFSKYYPGEREKSLVLPSASGYEPKILVTKEDSFTAAINQIKEYKTSCVLNFASARRPGGGYLTGAPAQEESLCRRSTLYASLEKQMDLYNWSGSNLRRGLYSDWCIFTPNVVIIRDENLELSRPFACSVVTSPAPNRNYALEHGKREEEIERALYGRCELILRVAASQNRRNLVLGAFGCGVFGNDPVVCAKTWQRLLSSRKYGPYFDHVTFAIKTGKSETNYLAFKDMFR